MYLHKESHRMHIFTVTRMYICLHKESHIMHIFTGTCMYICLYKESHRMYIFTHIIEEMKVWKSLDEVILICIFSQAKETWLVGVWQVYTQQCFDHDAEEKDCFLYCILHIYQLLDSYSIMGNIWHFQINFVNWKPFLTLDILPSGGKNLPENVPTTQFRHSVFVWSSNF